MTRHPDKPAFMLDPRINPIRHDLAARRLEDQVSAERFVDGIQYQVTSGILPMRGSASADARQTSQLLFGERFEVFEVKNGIAWGQAFRDDYVGYVEAAHLSADLHQPTHRLCALASHIYPAPDLKTMPLASIYMSCDLAVKNRAPENGFVELESGGWVYARHLAPTAEDQPDFVGTALKFLDAPYLWGGKSSAGLDCSALVQVALRQAGKSIPRDTDLQLQALGPALPLDTPPQRGDIAFFPGHVGIMLDETRILHANATHMAVSIDRLDDVIAIVARASSKPPFLGVCRL